MSQTRSNDLLPQWLVFVDHLMSDPLRDPATAYTYAYGQVQYPSAAAYELMSRTPAIRAEIDRREREVERKTGVSRARILLQEAMLAFHDPRRLLTPDGKLKPISMLSYQDAVAITGIKVKRTSTRRVGKGDDEMEVAEDLIELKLEPKGAALARLERVTGMNVDQIRIGMLDALPEDELDKRLALLEQAEQRMIGMDSHDDAILIGNDGIKDNDDALDDGDDASPAADHGWDDQGRLVLPGADDIQVDPADDLDGEAIEAIGQRHHGRRPKPALAPSRGKAGAARKARDRAKAARKAGQPPLDGADG